MALFNKMDSRKEVKFTSSVFERFMSELLELLENLQVLLENLHVLLESDIILLVWKNSV